MAKKKLSFTQKLEKLTVTITTWVGTPQSIIIHTLFFIFSFSLILFGISLNTILLILTTVLSLEAIYLALFIQMTVNRNTESLEDVTEDIDEIQEDVEDLQEDVQGVEEDVEDITEDIAEIQGEEGSEEDPTFTAIEGQLGKIAMDMKTLREEIQSLKHK